MKSREIKFRVFDLETNEMSIQVDGLHFIGDELKYVTYEDIHETNKTQNEPKYLMQYTGIKDADGTEIYDGDIVKGNHADNFVIIPMCGGLSILNVKHYGEGHNELVADPTNEVQTASWLAESKVIGNIYKNPGLLKSNEK